jgi:hypothetical protein
LRRAASLRFNASRGRPLDAPVDAYPLVDLLSSPTLAGLLTSDALRVLVLFMETAQPASHQPAGASAEPIDPSRDRSERCACCSGAADRAERNLRTLDELGEIGMRLVRAVEQQAMAQAVPEQVGALGQMSGGDLALAYSRLARAVRQTLALKAKLVEDRRTRDHKEAADQAQRAATIARARKERQKNKAKRIIEEAIDAEPRDPSDYENLLADLDDALEDLDADFGERPFGENIIRICRDLGITPNWTDWAMEAWGIGVGRIEAGGIEAGEIKEAGTKPSPLASPPFASNWPAPAQTGRSPESQPSPSRAASGSDPP